MHLSPKESDHPLYLPRLVFHHSWPTWGLESHAIDLSAGGLKALIGILRGDTGSAAVGSDGRIVHGKEILGERFHMLCLCQEKNKMKPTNPNADTYVEKQRFYSEPTCGTPWLDTLRWHSCRTHLLDTIALHSGKTVLLDTLIWHSCGTLLLDTLVRHSYLKLL